MRTRYVKTGIDILMTAGLLLLMGYQIWGEEAHEWIGTGMLVLFLAHHILNRSFYKSLTKGRYTPGRIVLILIDTLLLVAMAAQMYSGIVMSRHVFAFLSFGKGMALARRLHILGAYWGFLLMSVHLGLHWNMFLNMTKKKLSFTEKAKRFSGLPFLLGVFISLYGVWVFLKRDFPLYLFLQSEFVFLDYGEPFWAYYLDYLCLMGLWIFVAHYLTKFLKKPRKNKNKNRKKETGL